MTHTIEVTQADREAAADAVKAYRDNKNNDWQARIRRGECDDGCMVQAFAHHRTEALSAAGEPVAWMYEIRTDPGNMHHRQVTKTRWPQHKGWTETPLYTAPSSQRALVEAAELLESLCAWLLHRFGPEAPEGKEATFRLTAARAALSLTKAQERGV